MTDSTRPNIEASLQEKITCCAMLERLAAEELVALEAGSVVLLNRILRKKIGLIRKIDSIDSNLAVDLASLTPANRHRLAPRIETLRGALGRLQTLQDRATQLARRMQVGLQQEMNKTSGGRRLLAGYQPRQQGAPARFLHRRRA